MRGEDEYHTLLFLVSYEVLRFLKDAQKLTSVHDYSLLQSVTIRGEHTRYNE